MKTYVDILQALGACPEARNARQGMSVEEAMEQAQRGDWILWLASKLRLDHSKITLAKARCAKTVMHLMKDERSVKAVEVAEAYGLGEASREELDNAYAAANDAAYDAYAANAATAAYAAAAAADADAANAATADANDAAAAYAAYAAANAATANDAAAARKQNQQTTARLVIEILGEGIITEVNKRLARG